MTYGELIFWVLCYVVVIIAVVVFLAFGIASRRRDWGYSETPGDILATEESPAGPVEAVEAEQDWRLPGGLLPDVVFPTLQERPAHVRGKKVSEMFPTPNQFRWLFSQKPHSPRDIAESLGRGYVYAPWQLDEAGKPKKNEIPMPPYLL